MWGIMNKICETCDTRKRLKMCNGRDGDFKYCYRPAGSVSSIPNNITPFNTIDELFEKNDWIKSVIKSTATLDNDYYGKDHHMKLLLGLFYGEPQEKIKSKSYYPVGFVTC